ncbi:hypothetical protein QZH41_011138, partial [Actinostola sp. cb2023]
MIVDFFSEWKKTLCVAAVLMIVDFFSEWKKTLCVTAVLMIVDFFSEWKKTLCVTAVLMIVDFFSEWKKTLCVTAVLMIVDFFSEWKKTLCVTAVLMIVDFFSEWKKTLCVTAVLMIVDFFSEWKKTLCVTAVLMIVDFFMNGRKLFVSLLFKRIKSTDNGRYECKVRNTSDVAYGFGITYVSYASLPQIQVSRNITVEFGDEVSLACNFTRPGNFFITLVTIAWIKDSENIMEVPRPKEGELKDINLKIDQPEDGGHYRCKLVTLLHQHRTYNITKLIIVKVKPRFYALDLKYNRMVRSKGEAVEFNCNATGNPIIIVWKRKPRNEEKNLTINMEASSYNESHYQISSDTQYEGFRLEISKTDYKDRGFYYCCIRLTNTSVEDKECQRFILRVKDPLGYLWPLIGITIEAIVLFIILYASKKFNGTSKP